MSSDGTQRQEAQIDKINDSMALMAISMAEMSVTLKTFIEDGKENKDDIIDLRKKYHSQQIEITKLKGEVSKNKALNVLRWTAMAAIGGFLILVAKEIISKIT